MPRVVVGSHFQDVGQQHSEDIAADRLHHPVLGDTGAVVGILVAVGIAQVVPLPGEVDIVQGVLDSGNLELGDNLAAEGILVHLELAGDTVPGDIARAVEVGIGPMQEALREHPVVQGDTALVDILTF